MVNVCRCGDLCGRRKSGWEGFTTIKDVLKTKLDKTLLSNPFNSTVFSTILYVSGMRATIKKKNIDYDIDGYEKIPAGNIVAGTHPKRRTSSRSTESWKAIESGYVVRFIDEKVDTYRSRFEIVTPIGLIQDQELNISTWWSAMWKTSDNLPRKNKKFTTKKKKNK